MEVSEQLTNSTNKDTPVPLIIRAYAKDNKDKIVVDRQAVFIYPRIDKLKK